MFLSPISYTANTAISPHLRQLLAIVKFGSKEKRETAREAGAYARAVEKRMEKRRGGVKAIIE